MRALLWDTYLGRGRLDRTKGLNAFQVSQAERMAKAEPLKLWQPLTIHNIMGHAGQEERHDSKRSSATSTVKAGLSEHCSSRCYEVSRV